jgi:hypothetical protein
MSIPKALRRVEDITMKRVENATLKVRPKARAALEKEEAKRRMNEAMQKHPQTMAELERKIKGKSQIVPTER